MLPPSSPGTDQRHALKERSRHSVLAELQRPDTTGAASQPQPPGVSRKRQAAVLVTSVLVHFSIHSTLFMFGILYVELLKEFKAGKGPTAWIGSLAYGIMLESASIISMLCHRLGPDTVLMIGCLFCPISLLLSSLVTGSVFWLYLTFGVGFGIGCACLYPTVNMFSIEYFPERLRARVLGISQAGTLVGILALSPIYSYITDLWGWRRALWALAGLQLCTVYFAPFAYCPLDKHGATIKNKRKKQKKKEEKKKEQETTYGCPVARNHSERTKCSPDPLVNVFRKSDDQRESHDDHLYNTSESPISPQQLECNKALTETIPSGKQHSHRASVPASPREDSEQKSRYPLQWRLPHCSPGRLIGTFVDKAIIDRRLWSNYCFLVFVSAATLWVVCNSTPMVHLVNMVETEKGVDSTNAALLLTWYAAGGLVFVPVVGWLADAVGTGCRHMRMMSALGTIVGAANILLPFGTEYWHFAVYATVMGLSRSGVMMLSVLSHDTAGTELYSHAYASVCVITGAPDLLGAPIFGWITDAWGNYQLAYVLAGVTAILSVIGLEICARMLAAREKVTQVPDNGNNSQMNTSSSGSVPYSSHMTLLHETSV